MRTIVVEVPEESWVARQFRLVEESIKQRPNWMKPKACRDAVREGDSN